MAARVLVFGDSIAYGAWDPEGGWVDHLKRDLHQLTIPHQGDTADQKFQLLNVAIGGDTSAQTLQRVATETQARHSVSWPLVFVLATGINDSRTNAGVPEASQDSYLQNLATIIKLFRQYSDRILLVGLTPVAQENQPFKTSVFHRAAIRQFNAAAKELAAAQKLPFVDVYDAALQDPAFMSSLGDGLHPGAAGHEFLYRAIKPRLFKLIGIV